MTVSWKCSSIYRKSFSFEHLFLVNTTVFSYSESIRSQSSPFMTCNQVTWTAPKNSKLCCSFAESVRPDWWSICSRLTYLSPLCEPTHILLFITSAFRYIHGDYLASALRLLPPISVLHHPFLIPDLGRLK